jgi:PAS domain S-box-containing protein
MTEKLQQPSKSDVYAVIGEIFSDAIWTRDMKSGEGYWLAARENLVKYNLPDVSVSMEAYMANIHPDDRESMMFTYGKTLHNASVTLFEQEYRYKGRDRYYYIRDKVKIERDDKGVAIRCFGVWKDITDLYDREQVLKTTLANQEFLNNELLRYQEQLRSNEDSLRQINLKLKANVSDFKAKEDQLRASEEKFFTLFKSTPNVMSLARESDGVVVEINDKAEALVGYKESEILGRSIADLGLWLDPVEQAFFLREYGQKFKASAEALWKKKDGQLIYILISSVRVEVAGEYFRLSLISDITARKKAEDKFARAFNHSPDVMIIVGEHDGVILDVNDKISWLTGVGREFVVGENIDRIHLGFTFHKDYLHLYKRLGEIKLESPVSRSDGTEYYASITVSRIELAAEYYMLIILRDISEQKAAQNRLRRSEATLNATINNTKMLIWSIDQNYILLTCNEAIKQYVEFYHNKNIEVGGTLDAKVLGDVLDSEADVHWREIYNRAFQGETVIQNYSAFDRHFELSINPIWENGKVTGLTAFSMEITERVAHQFEVVRNLEQLAEAEKRIGELKIMALRAAMNPHFIFNALNSIQSFITKNDRRQAIQYLSTFSKLIRGILSGAAQNTVRLAEEIDLLRHYTNIELARFNNSFAVTFEIDPVIDKENIEVPSLLIQPFVENAILHGLYNRKEEGGLLKISVMQEDAEYILFEISDNGIGRAAAKRLKRANPQLHKSVGISLAEERLKMINANPDLTIETEDLYDGIKACGTRVKIWLQVH